MQEVPSTVDASALMESLRGWARELGFSQIGVADVDLSHAEPGLQAWLDAGHHGRMQYMAAHGMKRARPAELVPGTLRVITARMDYLPQESLPGWQAVEWTGLAEPGQAQISIYARGRDYHKVLRQRLQKLAERLFDSVGPRGYRVFTDSAPVLEVELAARSGLGWRGKHTLTLHRDAGSMFFLGEIFIDLDLPLTEAVNAHCGECRACIDVCPTAAITAPYRVDARRCISYLTIEHDGAIPEDLRPLMGNRVYGCDDCQLACPWNKFAQPAVLADFDVRPGMAGAPIALLLSWDEDEFLRRTEGSAIRRIGFSRWRRNLAVAAGNALRIRDDAGLRAALRRAGQGADALVAEHIAWALSAPPASAALSSEPPCPGATE
ncbi:MULTISPECIES: tRNA epoxyqueuosine(34) reductase QueG [unclassified Roseateles]|uniref:tRNA epoxyqueuosine(34) reductase QueG n=1 Tax=unclassified Roseateles TaxID=2626991 RepID=UPI000700DB46|nr:MULTISPECIES: tRNA epoxyqueuosine(34) reductase QueG [unclassified Roseateles]KQW43345.1 epoxyqueuosine reductase [Pelomonas sp. Root405]KRA71083.1 epoxyqueuosine reductase [Pelomonas sp. Root662]